MNEQEIKTLLARIQQAREAENEYDFIDRDFLSSDDIYYIFKTQYLPRLHETRIEAGANHLFNALYTWQFITDFTYPLMNCRKKKGETHLDHLNRRMKIMIPNTKFKVENLFVLGESTLWSLRKNASGRLA